MSTPKQPQDHKPKAEAVEERFSFEHGETTHTLKPTKDVLKPSFFRKTRNLGDFFQMCAAMEELVEDDAALEAFDAIMDANDKETELFGERFTAHMDAVFGATPGESKAS